MAQDNARASELTRPAVGQGEHAIERAVGGIAEVCFGRGRSAPTSSDRGCSRVVDTVDPTLPFRGEDASKRQEIIDSGLEMADRLVQAQYGFLRSLVHTAGSVVSRPGEASGEAGGD